MFVTCRLAYYFYRQEFVNACIRSPILQTVRKKVYLWSSEYYYSTGKDCNEGIVNDTTEQLEMYKGPVPKDRLKITYSRSSGPGGQNVNKVNTKAEVRFHIDSAEWIPARVKGRLKSMFHSRVTKNGELVVVSQEHRSQMMNLNKALQRVDDMLVEASQIPKGPSQLTIARVKALKRKAERRRLVDKKYHSQKKQSRRTDD